MELQDFIIASLQTQWLNNVGGLPLLCPFINTEALSVECFESLNNGFKHDELAQCAPAQYKSIRYDGKVRSFEFPHPLPYFSAIQTFCENWREIEHFIGSPQSKLKPKSRDDKERAFVMAGYLSAPDCFLFGNISNNESDDDSDCDVLDDRTASELKPSLVNFEMMGGKVVRLDIENFFNSIYTHAVEWVINGGRQHPNVVRGTSGQKIDKALQGVRTGRTDGVSIGPLMSNVVAEIILNPVDEFLLSKCREEGWLFQRNVDDYEIHVTRSADIDKLISDVARILATYSLSLNVAKTQVSDYLAYFEDSIFSKVNSLAPRSSNELSALRLRRWSADLRKVAKMNPGYSIVKYGWKQLGAVVKNEETNHEYIWNFSLVSWEMTYDHPEIVPEVVQFTLDNWSSIGADVISLDYVTGLLNKSCLVGRTDTVSWLIYYLVCSGYDREELAAKLESALTALGFFGVDQAAAGELRKTWLSPMVALSLMQVYIVPDLSSDAHLADLGSKIVRRLVEIFSGKRDPLEDGRTSSWSSSWPVRYQLYLGEELDDDDLSDMEARCFPQLKKNAFTLINSSKFWSGS